MDHVDSEYSNDESYKWEKPLPMLDLASLPRFDNNNYNTNIAENEGTPLTNKTTDN